METEEDRNYVCTLDEASLKKAKEELNEDPKERLGAVQTLRKWITEQPHLSCPTETKFLLKYLRPRYFSQLETRKLLEGHFQQMAKFPKWYSDVDTRGKDMLGVFDTGVAIKLPGRDKEGRQVILIQQGKRDIIADKYSATAFLRFIMAMMEYLFLDERTQVNGLAVIMDWTGITMKGHRLVGMDDMKNFVGHMQGKTFVRMKAIHMYNIGAFADLVLNLVKMIMPEKIQKRVQNHGNNLENLYKAIPMEMLPEEYLPDEYTGPNAGPIKDLQASFRKSFTSDETNTWIKYITSDKFKIDKSKKPTDIPQASFRKLNID